MRLSRRQFIGLAGALGLGGCARVNKAMPDFGKMVPDMTWVKGDGALTFAAINDIHVLDTRSTAIVNRAMTSINADDRVQFTVVLGDIATNAQFSQLNLAKTCFDRLDQPCFSVPGNHDVLPRGGVGLGNYTQVYGDVTWTEEDEGWVFIGLDSCESNKSNVSVQPERLEWLAKQIERIKPGRPIALFAHHPFNPNSKAYRVKNADEVIGMFAGHDLKLVAAGHYHGNQVEERDGVLYTTTACCSSTRSNFDKTTEKGYRLFHLADGAVETEFVVVEA
jgi:3',5'-cyclic-AMP phosphodiesterase